MNARARPYAFDDFAPRNEAAAAPRVAPATPDNAAVERARAEGVAEGRRLAMATIAADDAEQLRRLGDMFAASADPEASAQAAERAEILDIAAIFLEQFCAGLAADRELALAGDLLRRLTEHSEDRRPARLMLSPASAERLSARLSEMIRQRGLGDFVIVEADPALRQGDARLEWRGGFTRRSRAEIEHAVAALIQSFKTDEDQPS